MKKSPEVKKIRELVSGSLDESYDVSMLFNLQALKKRLKSVFV